MTLGLLDLMGPLLSWLDQSLAAAIPVAGRLVLWGLVAAALSMGLYALLSPQQRLQQIRARALEARRALDQHDGSLGEAGHLIRAMFATSLKQLGLVLAPAVAASVPVLFVLVWLHGAYGYALPQDEPVELRTVPATYDAAFRSSGAATPEGAAPAIVVRDDSGRVIEERTLTAPVTSLHKRQWWNLLIANPLGYLAEDSPLEWIEIDLPRREVMSIGPGWLRSWEFLFFTTLVAASLGIKLFFRLV